MVRTNATTAGLTTARLEATRNACERKILVDIAAIRIFALQIRSRERERLGMGKKKRDVADGTFEFSQSFGLAFSTHNGRLMGMTSSAWPWVSGYQH